jgi:hypothetical protein
LVTERELIPSLTRAQDRRDRREKVKEELNPISKKTEKAVTITTEEREVHPQTVPKVTKRDRTVLDPVTSRDIDDLSTGFEAMRIKQLRAEIGQQMRSELEQLKAEMTAKIQQGQAQSQLPQQQQQYPQQRSQYPQQKPLPQARMANVTAYADSSETANFEVDQGIEELQQEQGPNWAMQQQYPQQQQQQPYSRNQYQQNQIQGGGGRLFNPYGPGNPRGVSFSSYNARARGGYSGGGRSPVNCWICHTDGHVKTNCPVIMERCI